MFVNDLEKATNIDLEVTKKFPWIGEFSNLEFVNNDCQVYMYYIGCLCGLNQYEYKLSASNSALHRSTWYFRMLFGRLIFSSLSIQVKVGMFLYLTLGIIG